MSNIKDNLKKAILEKSKSNDIDQAVKEWYIDDFTIDEHKTAFCACGQQHLKKVFTMKNFHNGNILPSIGGNCIEQFGRQELKDALKIHEDFYKLCDAIRSDKHIELTAEFFSRKLIKHLYDIGAFIPSAFNGFEPYRDYEICNDAFGHLNTLEEKRQKQISAILVTSIKTFIKKKLDKENKEVNTIIDDPQNLNNNSYFPYFKNNHRLYTIMATKNHKELIINDKINNKILIDINDVFNYLLQHSDEAKVFFQPKLEDGSRQIFLTFDEKDIAHRHPLKTQSLSLVNIFSSTSPALTRFNFTNEQIKTLYNTIINNNASLYIDTEEINPEREEFWENLKKMNTPNIIEETEEIIIMSETQKEFLDPVLPGFYVVKQDDIIIIYNSENQIVNIVPPCDSENPLKGWVKGFMSGFLMGKLL